MSQISCKLSPESKVRVTNMRSEAFFICFRGMYKIFLPGEAENKYNVCDQSPEAKVELSACYGLTFESYCNLHTWSKAAYFTPLAHNILFYFDSVKFRNSRLYTQGVKQAMYAREGFAARAKRGKQLAGVRSPHCSRGQYTIFRMPGGKLFVLNPFQGRTRHITSLLETATPIHAYVYFFRSVPPAVICGPSKTKTATRR